MSKAKDRSKSKEKSLEKREKVDAETQRSLAVAEMKKAHKLIEETEKTSCFAVNLHAYRSPHKTSLECARDAWKGPICWQKNSR